MAFDEALRGLFGQTVTIAPLSSVGAFGGKTAGTAVSYDARVVYKQRLVKDTQGREVLATTIVYVAPTSSGGLPTGKPDETLTLPDGTTPNILNVAKYPGEDGTYETVTYYCG